ncbi:hypothetical protein JCM5296_004066 [Sporobolomyces johnsonii]
MPAFEAEFWVLSPLMQGVTVAIVLVPSALTGLMAGGVSDYFSRKWTISLGCWIFAVGSAISTGAVKHLGVLILGRCIAGVGEGLFLSAMGVYICEISPKHLRGTMMLLQQLFNTGSIAAAFFICYGTVNIPSSLSWRFPFALQTAISVVVAIVAPFMPYSLRWLLTKGRREEAERVLDLRVAPENLEERLELLSAGAIARTDLFSPPPQHRRHL